MKHTLLTILSALLLIAGGKELRTLVMTPTPQMHCENCENKIKSNLRFEKGVVKIETSIPDQTVTVTYNASKTDATALQAAMKKIGYDTRIVSDKANAKDSKAKKSKQAKQTQK